MNPAGVIHFHASSISGDCVNRPRRHCTADQITTLAIYSYQRGLLQFDLGMASAAGVVLLALCLVIAGITRLVLPNATRM